MYCSETDIFWGFFHVLSHTSGPLRLNFFLTLKFFLYYCNARYFVLSYTATVNVISLYYDND